MGKIKVISLIVFALFASCAGPYTLKDNGSKVTLSVNDTFEVVLNGDLQSEYSWKLKESHSFVKLQSSSTKKTEGDQVEYTFHLKASAQGKETVTLIYSNGDAVEKTFELLVVVGTLGPIL